RLKKGTGSERDIKNDRDDAAGEVLVPFFKQAARQVRSLKPDDDGIYRFEMTVMESLGLSVQLWNSHGLTNEDRSQCRIQVVVDNAPVARVVSPTEEMAVAADDVIDIKFEAHDDHGIAKAELVVYDETSTADGQPARILKVVPIPLGEQLNEK